MALPLSNLIDRMNSIRPMRDKLKLHIFKTAKRRKVLAKEILLKPGETCNYLFYIEEGVLSCFEIDEEKRYCIWLMYEGDIATSVDSFNNRVPSKETIQAVTDCVLWTITWQENEDLTAAFSEYGFIRQKLTIHYQLQSDQIGTQRLRPPEQCYAYLVRTFPDIVRVPNKTVASLMGISEPTLYAILKNRKNGK
jgi:CRP-like cAMP-binding protein